MESVDLTIPLVIAGITLAGVGLLRLTGRGFPTMPSRLAVTVIVAGTGVVVYGLAAPTGRAPDTASDGPVVTLGPADPHAQPPGSSGRVDGTVRTFDDRPVPWHPVELHFVPSDFATEPVGPADTTTTDGDGTFAFEDIEVNPGVPRAVSVTIDEVEFRSEVLRRSGTVSVAVGPTTTSTAALAVDVESLALVGDADGVQAVHALSLSNSGDEAYVGGVRLPLLPMATAVDPREGLDRQRLALVGGSMVSAAPVPPGTTEISYTYVAPMPASGLDVTRVIDFPTHRFSLLVSGDLRLADDPGDEIDVDDRTYRRVTFDDLDEADDVAATVTASTGPSPMAVLGIAAAAAVALGVIAFPLVRRRR